MSTKSILIFAIQLMLNSSLLLGKTDSLILRERGSPIVQNYSARQYGKSYQNFAISQDHLGILHFGNEEGVLQYDGVSWRFVPLANRSPVFSLDADGSGTVYAGGIAEFGFLTSDASGQSAYQSLTDHLSEEDRNFQSVWKTHACDHGVYFLTDSLFFRWKNGFHTYRPKPGNLFINSYRTRNQVFVQESNVGLMEVKANRLELLPLGDQLIGDIMIFVLPYDEDNYLIGTRNQGLILYDKTSIKQFPNELGTLLKESGIYDAVWLPDGTLAVATLRKGVFIIDRKGSLVYVLDKQSGLLDNAANDIFYSDRTGIWIASDGGISKAEVASPLSLFSDKNGLSGGITGVVRHADTLFVTTTLGMYYLSGGAPDGKADFKLFSPTRAQYWSLISYGNELMAASNEGVFSLKRPQHSKLADYEATALLRSPYDSTLVYVGHEGLAILQHVNGKWIDHGSIVNNLEPIYSIIEAEQGVLWLKTSVSGMIKVDLSTLNFHSGNGNSRVSIDKSKISVERYGPEAGLPDGVVNTFLIGEKAIFEVGGDLYQFDEEKKNFDRIEKLIVKGTDAKHLVPLTSETAGGSIILGDKPVHQKSDRVFYAQRMDENTFQVVKKIDNRLSNIDFRSFIDDEEIFWALYKDQLYRYDLQHANAPTDFNTLIRKVIVSDDSVIFHGANPGTMPTLNFQNRDLRFEFTSDFLVNEAANSFQYMLEGFDKAWSHWTSEPKKDYTNLYEGIYTFHVRSRNPYGDVGTQASFQFKVLPPWYRSRWAYLGYTLMLATLLFGLVRWRSAQLKRKNKILEKIIAERTEKVRVQSEQLQKQAEELKEMDQMKSRLFANISHEFRTPLTLIKGPVAELVKTGEENLRLSDAQMIDRNADRLLRLVNQLLDLSRLDAGNLQVKPESGDVHQFLRALAAAFRSHAEQRDMTYQVQIPEPPLFLSFDHDMVEKIVYNLLSNAFKFTPDGGEVSIRAAYHTTVLTMEVSDNGKGITPELLPHIFDRFYQADDSYTREQEGTGIGLALTQELVSLMNGEVKVQSEPGKGTTFTVTLPLSAVEHIEQDIVEKEGLKVEAYPSHAVVEEEEHTTDDEPKQEAAMVLVVEDNTDMRSFIKAQLFADYEILEAAHGKAGLEVARQEVPDLIITDLMMPRMDGMELCEQLKTDERTSHIPVIMLTAKTGQAHKIEGLTTGADDYLTKPFDREELQVRVKNLITQRQRLRERYSREVTLKPKDIVINNKDEEFLNRAIEVVETHIADNTFTAQSFQKEMGMSRMQLHRKLKALSDQSTTGFMRLIRLKRAAQLLTQKGTTVAEVAYQVGFTDPSHFTKSFKAQFGTSPSNYQDTPLQS